MRADEQFEKIPCVLLSTPSADHITTTTAASAFSGLLGLGLSVYCSSAISSF
jgi:hypothetical protein